MKVDVVIPFFLGMDVLERCIRSFHGNGEVNSVYVVNSGTLDLDSLKIKYSKLVEIYADDNFWWAAAVNSGIQASMLDNKTSHILLMNSDNYFETNGFSVLINSSFKNDDAQIIGSMVKYNNGQVKHCGVAVDRKLGQQKFIRSPNTEKTINREREIYKVDSFGGQGVLIKKEVFIKVGLFNAMRLPHYCADLDFYLRCGDSGVNIYCDTRSIIIDDIESTGLVKFSGNEFFKLIAAPFSMRSHLYIKNQLYLAKKYWKYPFVSLWVKYFKFYLGVIFRWVSL